MITSIAEVAVCLVPLLRAIREIQIKDSSVPLKR
jgi:hypothetical protein